MLILVGVELPLRVVVTILECCVTFSGVKLRIRSFVLFIWFVKTLFYKFGFRIQDNLSLIFLSSLELSKLIYFTHFHHYGSYLKIQAQVCPICQSLINPKTIQVLILWPLFGSLDRESWVVYDLMRLSSVAFIK